MAGFRGCLLPGAVLALQLLCRAEEPPVTIKLKNTSGLHALAYSRDGKKLVVGGDKGKVDVVDAESGKELGEFGESGESVDALAVSADGKSVVTPARNGKETAASLLTIRDLETGSTLRTIEAKHFVEVLCLSGDGRLLAAGGTGGLTVFDFQTGKAVWGGADFLLNVKAMAASPDGSRLAWGVQVLNGDENGDVKSEEDHVHMVEFATGKELRDFEGVDESIESVAFSDDGRLIAAAFFEGKFFVWDSGTAERKARVAERKEKPLFHAISFLPGGDRVVTLDSLAAVKVWDLSTREVLQSFGGHGVAPKLAVAPDGSRIAVSDGEQIRIWKVEAKAPGK